MIIDNSTGSRQEKDVYYDRKKRFHVPQEVCSPGWWCNVFPDLESFSKFGLLNATTPLYLHAAIRAKDVENDTFVEIDMDAWEELVPYIERLRITT